MRPVVLLRVFVFFILGPGYEGNLLKFVTPAIISRRRKVLTIRGAFFAAGFFTGAFFGATIYCIVLFFSKYLVKC
jgi:hypothetical protein